VDIWDVVLVVLLALMLVAARVLVWNWPLPISRPGVAFGVLATLAAFRIFSRSSFGRASAARRMIEVVKFADCTNALGELVASASKRNDHSSCGLDVVHPDRSAPNAWTESDLVHPKLACVADDCHSRRERNVALVD
jgi:hypothetical protein